ncbi:MAG: copper resistance CopC family protein [Acidobacteriaceae bacterium]
MVRSSPRWLAGTLLLFLGILLAGAPRMAFAHAVLLSSSPQKNAVLTGPDITINLKYNSRVDGARSTLSLLKPDGTVEKIGTPVQQAPDTLSAISHGLTKGAYVLRWQVLADDGHITRGEVPFQVK